MEEQHARLGPSNHRWPGCPGSPREESQYPDIAGEAAIDGTGSHLLLELCLKNGVPADHYLDQVIGVNHHDMPNGWHVLADRVERVQMALDYVKRRVTELQAAYPDCQIEVTPEQKTDPGGAFGRTDWWGTCDITIVVKQPAMNEVYFVEVIDYKDGRGYVSEKQNTQLHSYLFGQMRPFICSGPDLVRPFRSEAVHHCRMTIIQPKTNPVVRYVCSTDPESLVSVSSVVMFAEDLAQAARLTDDPEAKLVPGKHCTWCKANPKRGGHCTAQANQSIEVVNTMSQDMKTTEGQSLFEYIGNAVADPKSLTEEQLADLADAEPGILAVFDKVREEIQERIKQDIHVPGYEMAPGKGSNQWNGDEEVIVKKLKGCRLKNDDIYPKKLLSPAQMMKSEKLKPEQKERLQKELVTYVVGKKTLKKVARQAAVTDESQSAEMMFGDVANKTTDTEEVSFF